MKRRICAVLAVLILLMGTGAQAVQIARAAKPTRIAILNATIKMGVGETQQMQFGVRPVGASTLVEWSCSDRSVIIVSPEGLVTAVGLGKARLRVRSRVNKALYDSVVITVTDPSMPLSVEIVGGTRWIGVGGKLELNARVLPATAQKDVEWVSSNPEVLRVDDSGRATALRAGTATIGVSTVRGAKKDTLMVTVAGTGRATEVPLRYTDRDAGQVQANLKRIDAVYNSAVNELARLQRAGTITGTEFALRRSVLMNAFGMGSIAWYTDSRVAYWSEKYSLGGLKDFRPSRVYYGMPYIQSGLGNSRVNRRYTAKKAIKEKFFTKGQNGLMRMTSKRVAGRYVGNDCSAFVGMSLFPVKGYSINSSACLMLTSSIATSSLYVPIQGGYAALRPGDVMVKSGDHVVMFLYYANEDKSQMMIIEQGGGNGKDIHNTVCCDLVSRAQYEPFYRPRRARFLNS